MPYLSLTTWSLHRNLGPLRWTRWDEEKKGTQSTDINVQPETISLLELPAYIADKGYRSLDICHFQIPDTSEDYLRQLRSSLEETGIRLYTLLIDYGDISSENPARRKSDIEWMMQWIDIAALAGAERVRIIAGDADPANRTALARSIESLRFLCDYASGKGVRIVTENFRPLSSSADNCLALLDACGDRLGLIADFGNFKGPQKKYEELQKIVPRSESIHAKALTDMQGLPDREEFLECMEIVKQSGFEGPITIVYDGPHDMWEGIERVKELATPFL